MHVQGRENRARIETVQRETKVGTMFRDCRAGVCCALKLTHRVDCINL